MNEIIDLHRNIHANDFVLCEEYTIWIRTLLIAFLFCQGESPFAQCWVSSRLPLTLQLSALVSWRWKCALEQRMHGIAGSTGISRFFLAM